MAEAVSAGLLAYRWREAGPEFLLVHPGGPFWARRDASAWSIPKGLVGEGEDPLAAAFREATEELGQPIPGAPIPLDRFRTPSGKHIHCWMVEADIDVASVRSNTFEMEWPRGSDQIQVFPEIDRAAYFPSAQALEKIHRGLRPVLVQAMERLAGSR